MTEAPPVDGAAVPPPAVRRRHPVARGFGLVVGWLALLGAGVGLTAHFLDTGHQSLIVLASGAWVLAPLSVVALVLHLWRRAWFAVVVAVVVVVLQVVVYAPLFVAEKPPAAATTITVLTHNLLKGEAAPAPVVAEVRDARVDVFVAQELTPQAVAGLRAAGLDQLLPYSLLDPLAYGAGTGLWSRYPISDPQKLISRGLLGVAARIALPGGVTVTAVTLHPAAPFPADPVDWYRDLALVRTFLRGVPSGPVIAGGDFNSTVDHARFRRILGDGWRDGAEQAGAGLIRSWPSNRPVVPPLVGIDHVLTRGAVATSVRTVAAPGSDHLGLLATVSVPR